MESITCLRCSLEWRGMNDSEKKKYEAQAVQVICWTFLTLASIYCLSVQDRERYAREVAKAGKAKA